MATVLRVPADYLGYMAMKAMLEEIVTRSETDPFGFTVADAADIARSVLEYVRDTEMASE